MSISLDNRKKFNARLAVVIEKYPELYDHRAEGYKNLDQTQRGWRAVAKEMKLTVTEAKRKWRVLRTMFVKNRNMPDSHSRKSEKPHYLSKPMAFMIPFIRARARKFTNPRKIRISQPFKCPEDNNAEYFIDPLPQSTSTIKIEQPEPEPPALINPEVVAVVNGFHDDAVECAQPYACAQVPKSENDSNEKKSFLSSLLPEIEDMNPTQMKLFRRRVLTLIDEIMSPSPQ